MKILIIDKDQADIDLFSNPLKQDGNEIIVAHLGKDGLDMAKTQSPQLILVGQMLEDGSGNDVLKTLKTDPVTKNIPVAILSNFGQKELIKEAMDQGASDYILKYQVDPEDMKKKVKDLAPQT